MCISWSISVRLTWGKPSSASLASIVDSVTVPATQHARTEVYARKTYSKLSKPVCLADFRPISVTPILSRLTEKLIAQKWILPAADHQTISDQFAFRHTGSTRVPWYFLCIMLLSYLKQILTSVVYSLLIVFSKTSDVVDRGILAVKLSGLNRSHAILSSAVTWKLTATGPMWHRQANCSRRARQRQRRNGR